MIVPPDYYQVLGLQRDAEDSQIKSAYRKLALKVKLIDAVSSRTKQRSWNPRKVCFYCRSLFSIVSWTAQGDLRPIRIQRAQKWGST
jgi:preprotein translocase subunit Sec63